MNNNFDSLSLIGNTPLIEMKRYQKKYHLNTQVFAKLESNNLTGSIKDRIALFMIEQAEKEKKLLPGGTIIEPTSGNTGIGLACVGKLKGYKVIIVMPSSMSQERIKLIEIYGASVVLTSAELGMEGAVKKAQELQKTLPNSIILDQFSNLNNPQTHYLYTGPEIYSQISDMNIFVACIGTGGTISGIGKYLKNKNKNIKIIGVLPKVFENATNLEHLTHKIQGIGANFKPETYDESICDEIIYVSDEDAYKTCKEIPQIEGLLVGISSGAALFAAKLISRKYERSKIVVLFPDNGMRYLSTTVFDKDGN